MVSRKSNYWRILSGVSDFSSAHSFVTVSLRVCNFLSVSVVTLISKMRASGMSYVSSVDHDMIISLSLKLFFFHFFKYTRLKVSAMVRLVPLTYTNQNHNGSTSSRCPVVALVPLLNVSSVSLLTVYGHCVSLHYDHKYTG